ncbi:MAG: hypothetical protein O9327_02465 [Polaromonas sp.]|nr:hypothetical protein [Polaromonas sp.]
MSRSCERCSAVMHRPCQSDAEALECRQLVRGTPAGRLPSNTTPLPDCKPRHELQALSVKDLRRYAIDQGYGITYLSERKKASIIDIIVECDQARTQREAQKSAQVPAQAPA